MPTVVPAMRAARQRHGEMSFRTLNEIHVPFALISMILLPVIILAGRGGYGDLRLLAATVSVALLAKDTSGPNGRAASLGRRPCQRSPEVSAAPPAPTRGSPIAWCNFHHQHLRCPPPTLR
jgi:hypothetical protein